MSNIVRTLRDLYFDPERGVLEAAKYGHIVQSTALVIIASLVATADAYLTSSFRLPTFALSVLFAVAFGFVAVWVFGTLLCFVFAKFSRGSGDFVKLLTVVGYQTTLVYVMSLIDIVLWVVGIPEFLSAIVSFLFSLWLIYMVATALATMTRIPFQKAISAVLVVMVGIPAIFKIFVL